VRTFERTLASSRSFDETVAAVEAKAVEEGFRVLYTHDVAATLGEKGFPREPLKIVEICNAKYASTMLERDIRIALMLPCPISIYVAGGRTFLSTMLPTAIGEFFPEARVEDVAALVERTVIEILDEVAR